MNNEAQKNPKNYIWPVVIVTILLLILVLVVYYLKFTVSLTPKASTPNINNAVSVNNSYIFASPVRAKVNGDLIRVNVFLLDENGFGIFDKKVEIVNSDASIVINNIQNLSDETGRAFFDISGNKPGIYYLEAKIDNIILPQRVKLVFY